jgi:hypothetical protein
VCARASYGLRRICWTARGISNYFQQRRHTACSLLSTVLHREFPDTVIQQEVRCLRSQRSLGRVLILLIEMGLVEDWGWAKD